MVSSVLAQAILNQKAPDLVGSFREGQEIARQGKVRELSGEALEGSQGALDELAGLDPEIALNLGETIRAKSAKDINDYIRDAKIGLNQLNNGDVQSAKSFAYQRRDSIKQRGGDTTQTDEFIALLESGDIETARQTLQGFVGVLDQAKDSAETQEFKFKTEGLSEEDKIKAKRISLGLDPRAGISAQERIAADLSTTQQVADSQATIKGASAGASERAKLGAQASIKPQVDAAIEFAKQNAKNAANALKTEKSDKKALNVYEAAMSGLTESFEDASTGPIVGLLPAIANDDRVLEAAISIMSPVLKGVIREAGEGTFTDNDQKQIDNLMPTRKDNREVAKKKVELLDAFVRSKLSGGQQQEAAPQSPIKNTGGIKFLGFE